MGMAGMGVLVGEGVREGVEGGIRGRRVILVAYQCRRCRIVSVFARMACRGIRWMVGVNGGEYQGGKGEMIESKGWMDGTQPPCF